MCMCVCVCVCWRVIFCRLSHNLIDIFNTCPVMIQSTCREEVRMKKTSRFRRQTKSRTEKRDEKKKKKKNNAVIENYQEKVYLYIIFL